MTPEFFQLLDNFHQGKLSDEEIRQFRVKMEQDAEFKKEAEAYLALMDTLKQHGNRQEIKKILAEAHDEMQVETPAPKVVPLRSGSGKYVWMTAAAASIAIISIVGTMLITQSMDSRQTAYYKELRRNVQQIQRSQKQIMDSLAESKNEPFIPGKYSGTGFLISSNGYVATSYHVVKESDSVTIENDAYGRLKADVVYSDAVNDISILKIATSGFKTKKSLPFIISSKEAELGEYVYTLGFPREDIVFGEGSVSASSGFRQAANAYQVSVPVNPGNSGGPLLNSRGDLIGIVSGVQTETAGAAFAIKSSKLLDLAGHEAIDSLSTPLTFPRQNTIKDLSRVQQIKRWKELVFMVRVYKGN